MAQTVVFDGETHQFPDDFSDSDIASALTDLPHKRVRGFLDNAKDFFKSIPRGALSGLSTAGSASGQAAQIEMGQPVDVPSPEQTTAILEKNVTGALPVPEGRAGKYGAAVGEMLGNPVSYLGPGGLPAKIVAATAGGLGSEAAGQATEGTKYEPYARAAGAFAGPVAVNAARRAITPFPASDERMGLVKDLSDRGVTSLTAGEKTGSPTLQGLESKLGNTLGTGYKAESIAEKGKEQFTKAVMADVGETGMATQPELQTAKNRIGGEFNRLSGANNLRADNQLIHDIIDTSKKYDAVLDANQKPIFDKLLGNIVDKAVQGGMTGEEYQIARSQLGSKARGLQVTDPESAKAFKGLQRALDANMERGLSPADKIAWRKARDEYGRLKDIEGSVAKEGEKLVEGVVDPAALNRSISGGKDASAAARGQLPYSKIARAGAGVMVEPTRPLMQQPTLGGIAAALFNVPAGHAIMSGPGQKYLGNQLLRRAPRVNATIPAIAELLNAQGQR